MMNRINRRIALAFVALSLGLSACVEDENVIIPVDQTETERFFARYVSMGNSLTAGWMSGGINDSTQHLAYPVLLAAMANATFEVPTLLMPGCPPPLVGVVDEDSAGNVIIEEDRVANGESDWCALRETPAPEFIQNVAVPGAKMADAVNITREGNSTNPLTTLLLGGMTQLQAMRRAQPTLVTSWLGNNDVLGAAIEGDVSLLTPLDTFELFESAVATSIAGSGALGVVLIGVLDVTLAPVLQPGLYYWLADSLGYAPKEVDANCAPTDTLGELNPLSMNTVSWLAFTDDDVAVVSCASDAPYVLTPEDKALIVARTTLFNDVIEQEISNRNWGYVDATAELMSQLAGSAGHNRLRRCVGLNNTLDMATMVTFFTTRCPHPSAPNYFGSFVTYDGIHMSAAAHEIMAQAIADELEDHYELEI